MNSANTPIYIDWIVARPPQWPGRLGLTIAPGKQGTLDGKTHRRDLQTDLQAIQHAGADLLVNLMEPHEMRAWQMHNYHAEAARLGLSVTHSPIRDVNTPDNLSTFSALVQDLYARVQRGETIVVHCLGGLGRSGTLAACLLVKDGLNAQDAMQLVKKCRPGAIQGQQDKFVETYAQTLPR